MDLFFVYCVEILQELYEWEDPFGDDATQHNHNGDDVDTAVEDATIHTTADTQADTIHNGSDTPLLPVILCQCMHSHRCVLMVDS